MFTLTYRSAEDVNVAFTSRSVTRERVWQLQHYSDRAERGLAALQRKKRKAVRSSSPAAMQTPRETVDVFVEPDPNYHLVSLAYRTADGELSRLRTTAL